MCKVSDKLKLCTCKGDAESLKHYWILHRFIEGRSMHVLGSAVMPAQIDPAIDKLNEQLLFRLLNEGNAFDAYIIPLEKDRLEISFFVGPEPYERVTYGFEFKKGKWAKRTYDVFEWEMHHSAWEQGKVKNALERRNK
jgi:hypothetical protein